MPIIGSEMVISTGPKGRRVESMAAPTASTTIDATASAGSSDRTDPTKIGTPISDPRSTT